MDGQRVATASDDGTVRIWDARSGQSLTEPFSGGGKLLLASFSPERGRLLTVSKEGGVRIWSITTNKAPLLRVHGSRILAAAISSDDRLLMTADGDGRARLWDARTGELQIQLGEHSDAITTAAFSPDTTKLV